jgi:threonine aldolase
MPRVNLYSDTQTRPTPEMRRAMAEAEVGDEQHFGDPTVNALCERVAELLGFEAAVFLPSGTMCNAIAFRLHIRPGGDEAYLHRNSHPIKAEAGGPAALSGAVLCPLEGERGMFDAATLAAAMRPPGDRYHPRSRLVSVEQTTNLAGGHVWPLSQLREVVEVAKANGLRLHMDGARLANAIARLGCSPTAATWRAGVEVLSLGATKNGALAAEAVLVFDPALAKGLAERRKRAGHLLSKLRFLSAQLVAMLEQGRWLRYAAHANAMADRLAAGLAALPELRLVQPVEANELFVAMPEPWIAALDGQGFAFHRWLAPPGVGLPVVRLVTSFATKPDDVDALIAAAAGLQPQGLG